jgi:hypothetical protein
VRLARAIGVAALVVVLVPATAAAAPTWVPAPASLTSPSGTLNLPVVASNPRGDSAIAYRDFSTGTIKVVERPAGGSFSSASEVSAIADQQLGSIQLDPSGNIYVFFFTQAGDNNNSRPRLGVKPIGGSSWDVNQIAPQSSTDPPQDKLVGAVAPDGTAVAVWFQAHLNNSLQSQFAYSRKPAGSSTWAPKQTFTGFMGNAPGQPSLAINSAGQAVFAFTQQFNRVARGATMTAAGTWTALGQVNTSANNSGGLTDAVAAIDESGTATVAWGRNDAPAAGSGNFIAQFSTTTVGTAFPTTPASGANDLSPTGSDALAPAVANAPNGSTTIGWLRGSSFEERTRPPGGAFGSATTLANPLTGVTALVLAAGADGSMTALWAGLDSTPKQAIAGGRRPPGGATFSAVPNVPGTDNDHPALAADDQGNAIGAWTHATSPGIYTLEAAGLDAAGPAISNVIFPSTADPGAAFPYGATLTDRWAPSSASGLWAFGDGTVGPLNGTKAYAADGSFVATLTATDAFSNTSTLTRQILVGAGNDVTAPILTARLTNSVFAVNLSGAAEKPVAARPKKGTTFVYTLNEPARVVFTIAQKASGRRVRGKCRKPTRRNRSARKCTRFVKRGAFAQNGKLGQNRKKFSGKIGRKKLRPGRYRATLVARDAAGNRSKPKRLNFRVVRR